MLKFYLNILIEEENQSLKKVLLMIFLTIRLNKVLSFFEKAIVKLESGNIYKLSLNEYVVIDMIIMNFSFVIYLLF